jgi:hypothetical protein
MNIMVYSVKDNEVLLTKYIVYIIMSVGMRGLNRKHRWYFVKCLFDIAVCTYNLKNMKKRNYELPLSSQFL